MNRISRLLHKMNFLARQRRAVKYSHKYVITVNDTKRASKPSSDEESKADATKKVLEGFDPLNNEMDRRMMFEVTGMRLRNNEFQDDSSSGSSNDDEAAEELLPIDYAFMERFDDVEDDTGTHVNLTYALNP